MDDDDLTVAELLFKRFKKTLSPYCIIEREDLGIAEFVDRKGNQLAVMPLAPYRKVVAKVQRDEFIEKLDALCKEYDYTLWHEHPVGWHFSTAKLRVGSEEPGIVNPEEMP